MDFADCIANSWIVMWRGRSTRSWPIVDVTPGWCQRHACD